MKTKKMFFAFSFLLIIFLNLPLAFPADPTMPAEGTISRKIVRGFTNLGLGAFEIPFQIDQPDYGILPGWLIGLGKGIGRTVARSVVGAFELLTFPVASSPAMHPEFVWDFPPKAADA